MRFLIIGLIVLFSASVAFAEVKLIGTGKISGVATDASGLTEQLSDGSHHNLFGGISALEQVGSSSRYLAVSDRGPKDGAVDWKCRFHTLEIKIRPGQSPVVIPVVKSTTLLKDKSERTFTGSADNIQATNKSAGRFDPEGIRVDQQGHIFVSEEYGPQLIEFSSEGKELHRIAIPQRYLVKYPASNNKKENRINRTGRQSNRGMEGLTFTRDGRYLVGLMQSPLLQDSKLKSSGWHTGTNCRLLFIDIKTGATREYLYPLDHKKNKLNEILAVNNHEFLVIERDGEAGTDAAFKKIIKINIKNATNIQQIESLPSDGLPESVTPVKKEAFIDLLAPQFELAGKEMPEKIEGLTFGPQLKDGRQTLLIASDNDFIIKQPTLIYVFAFEADDLKTMPQN